MSLLAVKFCVYLCACVRAVCASYVQTACPQTALHCTTRHACCQDSHAGYHDNRSIRTLRTGSAVTHHPPTPTHTPTPPPRPHPPTRPPPFLIVSSFNSQLSPLIISYHLHSASQPLTAGSGRFRNTADSGPFPSGPLPVKTTRSRLFFRRTLHYCGPFVCSLFLHRATNYIGFQLL